MANPVFDEDDALVSRAHARVGVVLQSRWTLVRLLGLGGAAAVYEAHHRNGKRAAIKVLHAVYSGNEEMRTRFLREGYVANKITHDGVVSVLDDGIDETGAAFLVMDLLVGESLEDRRERASGRLAPDEVLAILDSVLEVLCVAHAAGIVHRDLKPENLFRTASGQIKVLDFGIARLLERSVSATATSSHAYLGTPAFMPPEQASARWKDVDARTDVWALGATALMLATGSYVHEGSTAMEVLAKTIMNPARPTREIAPYVPEALSAVIDRALAFAMADRFSSAEAMLEAVRAARRTIASNRNRSVPAAFVQTDLALPLPLPSEHAAAQIANTVLFDSTAHMRASITRKPTTLANEATPSPLGQTVSIHAFPPPATRSSRLAVGSLLLAALVAAGAGIYFVEGSRKAASSESRSHITSISPMVESTNQLTSSSEETAKGPPPSATTNASTEPRITPSPSASEPVASANVIESSAASPATPVVSKHPNSPIPARSVEKPATPNPTTASPGPLTNQL